MHHIALLRKSDRDHDSEERDKLLTQIPSPSQRLSLELDDNEYKGRLEPRRSSRPVLHYVLACLVFVGLTDLAFLAYISRIFETEYFDDSNLPLANPYIGLEELYSLGKVEPQRLGPLLNRPHIATQVYRDAPNRAGPQGEHRVWNSIMGELTPLDKHFVVDDKTRTIVQFRAMDFGMEECSLMLSLPGPEDNFEGKQPPVISDATLQLQVCSLDVLRFLDVPAVTWASRPTCADPPTVFRASVGAEVEVLPRFPCAWGTYQSFEVACADGGDGDQTCIADVWSSHNQTWGLYMYQHQTI